MDRAEAALRVAEHAIEEIKRLAAEVEKLRAAPKGAVSFLIDAEGRLVGIRDDGTSEVIGHVRGEVGPIGPDGPAGRDGVDGRDGAPGKLPAVAEWKDRVYHESDVVTLDGSTYQAQRDTGKAPPHDDWRCIARAGNDGADGRSLNFRSTWSADETYAGLDVAILDGGSFVALRDDPGPCPGDGWRLLVQRGKPGRPGEKGDRGDKGARGEPGPAVVGIEMDDTGMVTLANADGTKAQGDFSPALSRIGR